MNRLLNVLPMLAKVIFATAILLVIRNDQFGPSLLIAFLCLSIVMDEFFFLKVEQENKKRDYFGMIVAILTVASVGLTKLNLDKHIQAFTIILVTLTVAYLQLLKHNPLETFTRQQSFIHIFTMFMITLLSYVLLRMGWVTEKWSYGLVLLSFIVALRGGGIRIGEFAKSFLYELVLGKDYPKDG